VGTAIANPDPFDRRSGLDRRERPLHGLLAGHWLRRRRIERRAADGHPAGLDWHDPHWLGVAVAVLLLCIADAFMTLTLMRHGAEEINPLMAPLIAGGGPGFAYWKLGLTTFGVVVLTALARVRLFGVLPAGCVLYLILAGYIWLVAYEMQLLHHYGTDFISYWPSVPLQLAT
jgi:hypothetical protein